MDGGLQAIEVVLPAIVTVDLRPDEPRYASLPNIMKAKKKPLEEKTAADFGVSVEPRLKVLAWPKVGQADIVVAAVGQAEMIKGDWIKPGATVIDVGTSRVVRDGQTTLVGRRRVDVASRNAGAITPVPGGVGPMTIMSLILNTLVATYMRRDLPVPQLRQARMVRTDRSQGHRQKPKCSSGRAGLVRPTLTSCH